MRNLAFTRHLFWIYFLLGNFKCEKFDSEELFERFIANYSKDYGNDLDEKNYRFKVFQVKFNNPYCCLHTGYAALNSKAWPDKVP